MKTVIIATLIVLALSGNYAWEVVDSLPSCYTGLPFNIAISNGHAHYSY